MLKNMYSQKANPWFKFYFVSFVNHHHTLPYPKQKKIKFKPRIKLNHNSNLWELNIRGSLLRRGPDLNHYFLEADLLYIICSFLGCFPFVRTERPDHSRHIENFTFNQNYPSRSVKSWIVCTKEMVFSKNSWKKLLSLSKWLQWSGHGPTMVRPWSGHGPAMVRPWFGHGPAMVRPWSGRPVLIFGKHP